MKASQKLKNKKKKLKNKNKGLWPVLTSETFCREFLKLQSKSGLLNFSLKARAQTRMMYLSVALLVGGGEGHPDLVNHQGNLRPIFCAETELQKNKPRDTEKSVTALTAKTSRNISRGD